jgi:hypothetical protein
VKESGAKLRLLSVQSADRAVVPGTATMRLIVLTLAVFVFAGRPGARKQQIRLLVYHSPSTL